MWWLLLQPALADVAISTTCEPTSLVSTLPANGDQGVRPDAVVTLVFTDSSCEVPFFSGELKSDRAGDLTFTTTSDATSVVVVPDVPFEVGDVVHLDGTTNSAMVSLRFTIGEDGLPMTDEPSAVAIDGTTRCDGLAFTDLTETVHFDHPASGLLQSQLLTDGISSGWVPVGTIDGHADVTVQATALGSGQELCLGVRLLDESGALVWDADGDCLTADTCPATRAEPTACSTARSPLGAAWLAALALLRRSRRR